MEKWNKKEKILADCSLSGEGDVHGEELTDHL